MIRITLPDGSIRAYEQEIKVIDVAKDISEGLARVILGAMVNGKKVGLDHLITEDSKVTLLKFEDEEGQDIFRHTSSHIMAQAVQRLFPGTILAIGPPIDNGFYY
ncbi:MAG: TGS domain-containing protein, partial [Eubacteriales bacterium]|nr:TGS domain-containing protein [Eubacteriales bacterium]